jgi:hypothetical protein
MCCLRFTFVVDIECGEVNLTIATLNKIAQNLEPTSAALLKGIL